MVCDGANARRVGHIAPFPLPGGDRAARTPWRSALGLLLATDSDTGVLKRWASAEELATVAHAVERGIGPVENECHRSVGEVTDDPIRHREQRVIGHLTEPLLYPTDGDREGYVPNVVYTCGAMIHNGELIVPYSMSDTAAGVAAVAVEDLVRRMLE